MKGNESIKKYNGWCKDMRINPCKVENVLWYAKIQAGIKAKLLKQGIAIA